MAQTVNELRELGNGTYTITIGKQEFPLTVLCMDDFAEAQAHVVATRISRYWSSSHNLNVPPQIHSNAVADILSKPVMMVDLLDDYESVLKMLHLSCVRGGLTMDFKSFRKLVPSTEYGLLREILAHISGLIAKRDGESENPLEVMAATSSSGTSQDISTGETT